MPEPASILSVTTFLVGELGKGILGNRGDAFFCKSLNGIFKKLNSKTNPPENQDILKAARSAQLRSSLLACRYLAKHKYKLWDSLYSKAPTNLKEVSRYLKNKLQELENNSFKFPYVNKTINLTFLLKPGDTSIKSRINEIKLQQKLAIIDELNKANLNWVEKDLKDIILNGWKEGKEKIDWYNLTCAFFVEEIKSNKRLSTIIHTDYLLNAIKGIEEIQFSFGDFSKSLEEIQGRQKNIFPKLIEILSLLEDYKSKTKKTIKKEHLKTRKAIKEEISEEGKETRDLIQKSKEEIKQHINLTIQKENPYAKYVGTLVDLFGNVTKDEPLDIEIALNKDGRIILFHNLPLKIFLKRIEFIKDTNELIFVNWQNKRWDVGITIASPISEAILDVKEIQFVEIYDPESKKILGEFKVPLKVLT